MSRMEYLSLFLSCLSIYLCFIIRYVGEMGKDYIYAITPLLEDALTDRDLVHRQTAASAVKHLALGV
jgi:splicing factor 3B subunit 1